MCRKMLLLICLSIYIPVMLTAQELKARININTQRLSSQADKKAFQTCQSALNDFLNNRKWTSETFQANEKIVCNFLLSISDVPSSNVYKATLTVQAAR